MGQGNSAINQKSTYVAANAQLTSGTQIDWVHSKWIDGFDLFKAHFDHTDYAGHARSGNCRGRKVPLAKRMAIKASVATLRVVGCLLAWKSLAMACLLQACHRQG